jgi:branched-chain amino acid transport system ATP-binding protein
MGKTTTVRSVMGLTPAMAGSIRFDGAEIRGLPAYRVAKLGIGLVPEGRQVLRRMTVYENLLMGAYGRSDSSAVKEDIKKVFERFPILEERSRMLADVLSGGEQQMLAIGRALLARPKLLMLDEPSLGLSPILVEKIFSIITDLHQAGITIFLIEQNAHKALQVADRGYVMETGKIVMAGDSRELRESESLRDAYLGSEKE